MEEGSSVAEDDGCPRGPEVSCLMRVGRNSDWLRLLEDTEVSIGRGVDVTYQLLSPSCPLMISRLHCTFTQREDGQWTVTDKKSLNGVWVNGNRIHAEKAHQLRLGDSIRLGVPVSGTKVEFDYILVQRPLKDIRPCLAKGQREGANAAHVSKKPKRKLPVEEVEPSTSKPKLYRLSSSDTSFAKPCPLSPVEQRPELSPSAPENTGPVGQGQEVERPPNGCPDLCDLDNLQMYNQNLMLHRSQGGREQSRSPSPEGRPQQAVPLGGEQVRGLQGPLQTPGAKTHRMETLEKTFSETKRQLEAAKTQQQDEHLKKQLEDALQKQKKVIDELAHSRQGFEEIISAKNKELEVTKEEKEKVTQVTEVLENELQCIICSELFIEAVILNCAHSFCCHCIRQWRQKKDECPMCRQAIQSQTRCLALDNCVDGMVENLSLDMRARRQALITERKAADSAAVTVIHDDDSSMSSGSDHDSMSSHSHSSLSSEDQCSLSSYDSDGSFDEYED